MTTVPAVPLFVATDVTAVSGGGEQTLLGAGTGPRTLTAGRLSVGDTIYAALSGHLVSGPNGGRLTVRFKFNGETALEASLMPIPADCTDNPWRLQIAYACQRAGDDGRGIGIRIFSYLYAPKMPLTWILIQPESSDIDTAASLELDVSAEWHDADPLNRITCEEASIELLHEPIEDTIHMA